MHHLWLGNVTQKLFEFGRRLAAQHSGFGRSIVGQATGNFGAGCVAHGNHVAARKVTLHSRHTDRQQTLAFITHLGRSPRVHHHRAAQLKVVGHPLFAGLLFLRLGHQQRTQRLPLNEANQHIGFAPPGNDRGGARTSSTLGRLSGMP